MTPLDSTVESGKETAGNGRAISRRLAALVCASAGCVVALALGLVLTQYNDAPGTAVASREVIVSLNRRANALAAAGRHEEAMALLARALELDPACAPAHYNRGKLHHRRREFDAAMREYDAALALRADYVLALTNRAILLSHAGETDRAIADLSRSIELAPERTAAYYHRARLQIARGMYANALADLDMLLALDPDDAKAVALRERAREALGLPR